MCVKIYKFFRKIVNKRFNPVTIRVSICIKRGNTMHYSNFPVIQPLLIPVRVHEERTLTLICKKIVQELFPLGIKDCLESRVQLPQIGICRQTVQNIFLVVWVISLRKSRV